MALTIDWRDALASIGAPTDRPTDTIDARDLPPPEPLRRTLERLADLEDTDDTDDIDTDDRTVLLQVNDRAPQHLYPRLDDRGYRWGTVETDDGVLTAVWRD